MSLSRWGTGISLLCAVHCAALPLLAGASLFPAHGPGGHWLEATMVGIAALIGYTTLGSSYRHHRRPVPLALLTVGLAALLLGHSVVPHGADTLVSVSGALLLVGAQLLNRRCPAPCCAGGHTV
ncbi:MAG TPA: MerC domain-containing protein [Armatimonadota bacterium]|nr:MerC domain-containing protein [Armatimonadota bacterium]